MIEGAARSLPQGNAGAGGVGRLGVEVALASAQIGDEVEALLLHDVHGVHHLDGTGGRTAEGRLEIGDVAFLAELLEDGIDQVDNALNAALVRDKDTGQRSSLVRLAVVTGSLAPAVLAVHVVALGGVPRVGDPLEGVHRRARLVVSTGDVLGDGVAVDVGENEVVALGGKDTGREIALVQSVRRSVEDAPGNVVAVALAIVELGGVDLRKRNGVGQHDVVNPALDVLDAEPDVIELLGGGHKHGAAGDGGHDVGHLAAEDAVDLGGLGLHLESLDVVGGRDEVELRGQGKGGGAVRVHGVEPVARENRELAVLGKRLEALLEVGEVRSRQAVLHADIKGVGDVGVDGVERVHVVQAVELIEPEDGAVHELRHLGEVAHHAAALGRLDAEGVLSRNAGSVGVRNGAHAADALCDDRRVLARAVLEDELHAAEQTRRNPSIRNDAVGDLHLDAQVAFDSGYRVNGRDRHYLSPPFLWRSLRSTIPSASSSL